MKTSYMDFEYDAYIQSYPDTTNLSPLEINITPAVCAFMVEGDNTSRDVCLWRLHASAPKNSCGYFMIKKYKGEHTRSQPTLNSNHREAITCFVCNVILPIVTKKLDMTPDYIINYTESRYHITISYNKA